MLTLIALVVALVFLSSPWSIVLVVAAAIVDIGETVALVWWSQRRPAGGRGAVGAEALVGRTAVTLGRLDSGGIGRSGQVRLDGEIWNARSTAPIDPGVPVTVCSVDGLVLVVEPAPEA